MRNLGSEQAAGTARSESAERWKGRGSGQRIKDRGTATVKVRGLKQKNPHKLENAHIRTSACKKTLDLLLAV